MTQAPSSRPVCARQAARRLLGVSYAAGPREWSSGFGASPTVYTLTEVATRWCFASCSRPEQLSPGPGPANTLPGRRSSWCTRARGGAACRAPLHESSAPASTRQRGVSSDHIRLVAHA